MLAVLICLIYIRHFILFKYYFDEIYNQDIQKQFRDSNYKMILSIKNLKIYTSTSVGLKNEVDQT